MPERTPPTHFSMLRGYQLADLLTLANGASGTAAILSMMNFLVTAAWAHVWLALAFILVALLFDVADGRVARGRHKNSAFGQELDSLADIVSFGVAPAALAFGLGMRGAVDVLILVYFVACGISRLARFNVTAAQLATESGKVKYFEGTPIPSSVILVVILGWCFYTGRIGEHLPFGSLQVGPFDWHPLSLIYFINGSTMISKTLRIPKF